MQTQAPHAVEHSLFRQEYNISSDGFPASGITLLILVRHSAPFGCSTRFWGQLPEIDHPVKLPCQKGKRWDIARTHSRNP